MVGSLGGWDPANEPVLKFMSIKSNYARTIRKLIVSDTIRWSRDIYVEHVSTVTRLYLYAAIWQRRVIKPGRLPKNGTLVISKGSSHCQQPSRNMLLHQLPGRKQPGCVAYWKTSFVCSPNRLHFYVIIRVRFGCFIIQSSTRELNILMSNTILFAIFRKKGLSTYHM